MNQFNPCFPLLSDEFINNAILNYKNLDGEQETKNNLIEPLFAELGYEIDCVEDIRTEYNCDFGIKNEKVDYVLCISGIPKILVEAKDWKIKLGYDQINQLHRYFAASDCKLGILTNGIEYFFFSDFVKENIMDNEPFHKLNIFALRPADKEILRAICKTQQCSYDINSYIKELKTEKLLRNKNELAKLIASVKFNGDPDLMAIMNGITRVI